MIATSRTATESDKNFKKDSESMDVKESNKLQKELQKKMYQVVAELSSEETAMLCGRMLEVRKTLLELE